MASIRALLGQDPRAGRRRWLTILALATTFGVALAVGCHAAGRGAGPGWKGPTQPPSTGEVSPPVAVSAPSEENSLRGLDADHETASLGLGLAGLADWSTQVPFLDLMKSSRTWHDWAHSRAFSQVDENGWVKSISPGETPATVFLTVPDQIPVPYSRLVVHFEGRGRLAYGWSARLVSSDREARRDVITVVNGSALLTIEESSPEDPVRAITIVPAEFEKEFLAGEVFNPDWLKRIGGVRAVRFMDWMGTNASTHTEWRTRPLPEHRSWASPPRGETTHGVPVEIMVALANRLDVDPWFNMPHGATDEYVRSFATYVHKHLKPHLVATVEFSNELWNFSFAQSQFALKKAEHDFGKKGGSGWVQWGAVRAGQVCDIWKRDVFKDGQRRVHCTLGVHSGWEDILPDTLDCPWAARGHGKCYTHGFDSIAMTGYFSGCLEADENATKVRAWFGDPDGGVERAAQQVADGAHFKCEGSLAQAEDRYRRFQAATARRNMVLVAYEGGQHITANGHALQDDPAFTQLFSQLNRAPQMGALYRKNFEAWRAAGGTLFMHFVDIAHSSKFGSWGALEHLRQEDSPKWKALSDFNRTPCWWEGCRRQKPHSSAFQ